MECIGVKNKDDLEPTRSLELLFGEEESGRSKATLRLLHRRYLLSLNLNVSMQ